MIGKDKGDEKDQEKEKIRKRIHVAVDRDNYEYYPGEKQTDFYDHDTPQRVAVYVRVSTDDIRQTTSYELQKKYYEDFVVRHPNWTLVKIYSDEGISGTSMAHRDAFQQMIRDCKAGMIDLIVTKSVSRFARNVVLCVGIARDLAELEPPVGVFFESECIFSLNDDSKMAFTFQAAMAEEESRIRSRSMESSLRMRLDNGIPLTPKLLGYRHDGDGNLVVNPDEAPTVKLAFYMYLYGYSTQQIADAFTALGRRSYLGNTKWTSGGILQILRNERHCGDVLTRKTYTPNYLTHLAKKNRGQRPQSRYLNHHEAIISRDDFNAVQQMLDNAKYGNRSILPELRIIDSGKLKGFVIINPRWAGFQSREYFAAAQSVMQEDIRAADSGGPAGTGPQSEAGDFDLRGFEITRSEFLDTHHRPRVAFGGKKICFNAECVRQIGGTGYAELLADPIGKRFAVRPADAKNRNAVRIATPSETGFRPRDIAASAFSGTLFALFGWIPTHKYQITGVRWQKGGDLAYIFDSADAEALIRPGTTSNAETAPCDAALQPLISVGKHIRAIPKEWTTSFGKPFYLYEQDAAALERQSEEDWKLRLEGRLFEAGKRLSITGFEELRRFIKRELGTIELQEGQS